MRESLRDYCRRMNLEWVADEFCCEKNAPLTPETVSYGSSRPMWWRCGQGHEFQASPSSRRNGSRCPYCAGVKPIPGVNDLATAEPRLAAQWHPTRNGGLTPRDVLATSKRLIWWRCEEGHEWTACPKDRLGGRGCPVCEGKGAAKSGESLTDAFPRLARQWDYRRNGLLVPTEVGIDSTKRVWWECENGHEWQASVLARTTGNSPCPICSGRRVERGVNDLRTVEPRLAAQWAAENGPLKPEDVAANSRKRVWWTCQKGHIWRAAVENRVKSNSPCPYCSGQILMVGYSDLKTLYPQLAAQWHPTRNGSLGPEDVKPDSRKQVWWLCESGHSFRETVAARTGTKHAGCPVCAGLSQKGPRVGAKQPARVAYPAAAAG